MVGMTGSSVPLVFGSGAGTVASGGAHDRAEAFQATDPIGAAAARPAGVQHASLDAVSLRETLALGGALSAGSG
jgi:hypothetical protein